MQKETKSYLNSIKSLVKLLGGNVGKPFEVELHNLNQTYQWSLRTSIDPLSSFIEVSCGLPLMAVGSGGALTAAHIAASLHQRKTGMISKAITPLEFIDSDMQSSNVAVMILSAGGRNPDILSVFKHAISFEPCHLITISMHSKSPLVDLAKSYCYTHLLNLDLPVGSDGFLATNSLIAFTTILIHAYKLRGDSELPAKLPEVCELDQELKNAVNPLIEKKTWSVLYGSWGTIAAVDIESKLTEAALNNVQIADYRNFAHGRHNWLAKRGSETGIIALITPNEKDIARKTLDLIPMHIPRMHLVTEYNGPIGAIDLLVKIFYLVHLLGVARNIDPGNPGVPPFGRRIYHTRFSSRKEFAFLPRNITHQEAIAIVRKNKVSSIHHIDPQNLIYWRTAYQEYIRKMKQTLFGAVAFDYDGTLCDPCERYSSLSKEIVEGLMHLLEQNVIIGVATGRGGSVRDVLQNLIPNEYWGNFIIGYYNGSDIALLHDQSHPDKSIQLHPALQAIQKSLTENQFVENLFKFECRPRQITIEMSKVRRVYNIEEILRDIIARANVSDVKIFKSSHSIDILPSGVSKLLLVEACEERAKQAGNPRKVLCIGDKGEWPGNDYEFLSSPYSLSVDTVSTDPKSCWNFSQPGHKGIQATISYLKRIKALNGMLSFK